MTLEQLNESRTIAIAAYESAASALRAAYVELAAFDRASANGEHFNGRSQIPRSFNADLSLPGHPDVTLPQWDSALLIHNRADQLLA
jgi:hypothetical protein